MATSSNNIDKLPEECVSTILSYTSPVDACKFLLVSYRLRSAADSDIVWQSFLPSYYEDIISRALNPITFCSKKDLFFTLCLSTLIDGGNKSFKLHKLSGKISYILSARELSLTWSDDPLCWSWRPTPESRFAVVAELRTVSRLEIKGKIRTKMLTPNTLYGAYVLMKQSHRAYGLDSAASKVSVEVGNRVRSGKAYLCRRDEKKKMMESLFYGNRIEMLREGVSEEDVRVPCEREDGWMEIELGEFFTAGEEGDDEEVKMSLMEVGYLLKGGLIVEGIEVRPQKLV